MWPWASISAALSARSLPVDGWIPVVRMVILTNGASWGVGSVIGSAALVRCASAVPAVSPLIRLAARDALVRCVGGVPRFAAAVRLVCERCVRDCLGLGLICGDNAEARRDTAVSGSSRGVRDDGVGGCSVMSVMVPGLWSAATNAAWLRRHLLGQQWP